MTNELIQNIITESEIFQCMNDRKPIVVIGKNEEFVGNCIVEYDVVIGDFNNGFILK